MTGPLHARLLPVRRRQLWLVVLRSTVAGLLVTSSLAALLGLAKVLLAWPVPTAALVGLLVVGPIVGSFFGLARRPTWHGAARAVDAHYRLKDRTSTALVFLSSSTLSVFQELEIADALKQMRTVDPAEVVPLRLPRSFPIALAAGVVALTLLFWPGATPEASAGLLEAIPGIVKEADNIGEDLKDLERAARIENDEKLVELVRELQKKVEEMKQPGVSLREAMSKISEIQVAIAQHAAELNTRLVDDKLKDLGEAMGSATPLEKSAKALQEGDYEKAAKSLEETGEPRFDDREAKAASEKVNRVSEDMRQAGLRRLGDAAKRMSAGMRGEKKQEFKEGAKELAKELRQQERRKRINELLSREQNRLTECKNQSQQSYLRWLQQQNSGSKQSQQPNPSLAKAQQPTRGRGDGGAGAGEGKRARLLPTSEEDKLPSKPGGGEPGERTPDGTSPKGSGKAALAHREQYLKHRREMEAALEREPIPIGQRDAIRRYFDLIQPADGEKKGGD